MTALVVTNSRSAFAHRAERPRGDPEARRDPFGEPDFTVRKLPWHPIHARRFPEAVKAALVASADAMAVSAVRDSGRLGADLHSVEVLDDLEVPLLVANGVYEKSFQNDVARLKARYPDLEVVDMAGGHSVNIEAAAEFDAAVLAFLARHGT